MPSIKDFEKKKKVKAQSDKKQSSHAKSEKTEESLEARNETPKRRPSKEDKEAKIISEELHAEEVVNDETSFSDANDKLEASEKNDFESAAGSEAGAENIFDHEELNHNENKIQVEFPGSFILRSKYTKTFEAVDKIATDWINDGDFEGLPVGHPLLQILAAKSLQKAKDLEKKAQNTQAYSLAKIGLEYAKSKLKKK